MHYSENLGQVAELVEKVFCRKCRKLVKKSALDNHLLVAHRITRTDKVPCPKCGKRVKAIGLKDHMRVVHND